MAGSGASESCTVGTVLVVGSKYCTRYVVRVKFHVRQIQLLEAIRGTCYMALHVEADVLQLALHKPMHLHIVDQQHKRCIPVGRTSNIARTF